MKHTLDFEIYTRGNAKTLILVDTSDYFEKPSNKMFEVKFPNFEKYYKALGNKEFTSLNTKLLGYSSEIIEMPDGLYTIRMSVAPNQTVFKCKNYLKSDKLISKLNSILNKECLDLNELKIVSEVDVYLTTAQAIVDESPEKSVDYYQHALKLLNKTIECNGL